LVANCSVWLENDRIRLPPSYAAAYLVRSGRARELYLYNSQKQVQTNFISMQAQALPFVSPATKRSAFASCQGSNSNGLSDFSWSQSYFAGGLLRFAPPWMSHLRAVFRWLPAAIFLGFLPIAAALIEGQISILLLTFLTVAFVLASQAVRFSGWARHWFGIFQVPDWCCQSHSFIRWRAGACCGFCSVYSRGRVRLNVDYRDSQAGSILSR